MVRLSEKRIKYTNRPYSSRSKHTAEIINIKSNESIECEDGDKDIQELSEIKNPPSEKVDFKFNLQIKLST